MTYGFIHCLISSDDLDVVMRYGIKKEKRSHLIKCGFPILELEKFRNIFGDIYGKIILTLDLDIVADTITLLSIDEKNGLFETDDVIPPECIINHLIVKF